MASLQQLSVVSGQSIEQYHLLDFNVQCYRGTAEQVTQQCSGRCCVGHEACAHWSGVNTVCEASCIGDRSCKNLMEGMEIRTQSCVGLGACRHLEISDVNGVDTHHKIAAGSCRGRWACFDTRSNSLHIGVGSCIGEGSCRGIFHATSGKGEIISIGNGSCIGDGSCEYYTARDDYTHSLLVNNNDCIGENSCYNCYGALVQSGDESLFHLSSNVC